MQNKQLLLEAIDISFHVGGRQILKHISLRISAGETVTLIGPNGAGKTAVFHHRKINFHYYLKKIFFKLLKTRQNKI
jgi:ABC-type branched-subunit amino acid transport system ATPase component